MFCTIEILGFGAADRKSLAAILVLSLRRDVMYSQWSVGHPKPPGLLLVDGDNPQAVAEALSRNLPPFYPVVLVSINPPADMNCVYVQRPIRYLSLFDSLDQALRNARPFGDVPTLGDHPVGVSSTQKNAWAPTNTASIHAALGPITIYDLTDTAAAADAVASKALWPVPSKPVAPRVVASPPTNVVSLASSVERPAMARASGKTRSQLADAAWVLVVDDDLANRRFMESRLSQFNINVDYAASGEQAVGLTGTKHYACVFLDVVMSGMDGYQVCKIIKSNRASKDTRVVMLTSRSSTFDRIRGTMAGCDAYLTKPVDEEKLVKTISRFLPATGLVNEHSADNAKMMGMDEPEVFRRRSDSAS